MIALASSILVLKFRSPIHVRRRLRIFISALSDHVVVQALKLRTTDSQFVRISPDPLQRLHEVSLPFSRTFPLPPHAGQRTEGRSFFGSGGCSNGLAISFPFSLHRREVSLAPCYLA